ncbi:VCBS repeat-containing protein [Litoribacter alkaliphilus]|uniref:VCBS repeat-containing protein n=1 Tax=Litoribacter ruber TaxID=702568 RepID=A0AAP2CHT6_9BACT|nr:VCBS repeat-containing protein [Litoribacter alkaliphilus]MBS9523989.1 VCBS repeat-containing protein [Litoribacter alkaliphilus]
MKYRVPAFICLSLFASCSSSKEEDKDTLFRSVSAEESGIHFSNELEETVDMNIFTYMYFYNGGGVAVGDVNGDGLLDVYFTSNQNENKLYLNEGNLKFRDITEESGVAGFNSWTTGVSMADVNGDGLMDIYVSYLGDHLEFKSQNQLFINQGNDADGIPSFRDEAADYGLNLIGFSTQAVFFDYDLDGDLDMFMLNHSVHNNGTFGPSTLRDKTHPLAGDKLLRNDNGRFVDVTEEAGIFSSAIGYGLGVVISDVNLNGYPDIFVGNDFHENDYLYINNGDGTFTNKLNESMMHTSHFSMGVDFADLNNDGFPELFTLDMLPEDPKILKASAAEDPYDVYNFKLNYGFTHQFARNTLQLNNGNGTFSEVGMMAGVHATDWSWSTFLADLDLDGYKDIFVANGILRRSNDLDYINFITDEDIQYQLQYDLTEKELALIEKMPTIKLPNYVYRNNGNMTFTNMSKDWGLNLDSYSNGAVFVDLDNDGDLDIVVNNINDQAFVLENRSIQKDSESDKNYVKILLEGKPGNNFGVGSKVLVYQGNDFQIQEVSPVKGFMSSSDYRVNFGFSKEQPIDSLIVIWPDFSYQIISDVSLNQTLEVQQTNASGKFDYSRFHQEKPFTVQVEDDLGIDFKHKENTFNEFTREPLLPHMLSAEGPAAAVADVNGDGLEDLYIGGAKHQAGKLYLQTSGGRFRPSTQPVFQLDSLNEDVSAIFGDFAGNGFQDLLVVSGGNEFYGKNAANQPRLYVNDGKGNFSKSENFPTLFLTGSVVAAGDFDGDGDLDLFIGARTEPWKYGSKPQSYLLENKGNGKFEDVTAEKAPFLEQIGKVKDAKWLPLEDKTYPALVIAAEWEPITIIKNEQGKLTQLDVADSPLAYTNGWWNTIVEGDFDGDGRMDFIMGNLGTNSKLKASKEQPLRLYVNDFDENGTREQVLSHFMAGREYPFHTKDELSKQVPSLKKQFLSYSVFAEATLEQVFGKKQLEESARMEAYQLNSLRVRNLGNYKFEVDTLPFEAQISPIQAGYYDAEQKMALLGGNFYPVNVQRGRYDASYGLALKGSSNPGKLTALSGKESGLKVTGETRRILPIIIEGEMHYLFIRNNDTPVLVKRTENGGQKKES